MADPGDIEHGIHGECRPRGPSPSDRKIAELAERQHGVVARRQLMALELGPGAIDHRVACGRLHPVHRGVYAVGHPRLMATGLWMAAVLACGPDALLSHRSAAALWGLQSSAASRIDVTAPGRRGRGRPGIMLHRVGRLQDEDRSSRDGIPVTTVARTLLDLAESVSPRQLGRALEEAERLRLLDLQALHSVRDRSPGRQGLRALSILLADGREPLEVRSELERRFVELCREANLPLPALNAPVAGHEVDALWLRQRLIVELDGYAFHGTRAAFERDRARDLELQLAGYRVLRVTSRRLDRERPAVAAAVRSLLATQTEGVVTAP
jgi:predicted transcriptional regulator of viral defense system